jgi:hypothetical protein
MSIRLIDLTCRPVSCTLRACVLHLYRLPRGVILYCSGRAGRSGLSQTRLHIGVVPDSRDEGELLVLARHSRKPLHSHKSKKRRRRCAYDSHTPALRCAKDMQK